jgi:peptide/nickel transport system substrate-binding protein
LSRYFKKEKRDAISRVAATVIIIVILIVAGVGAYYALTLQKSTASSTTSGSISSSTSKSSTGTSSNKSTIVVDETLGEPSGLDVAYSTDAPAYEIEQNIYQGLLFYTTNDTLHYGGVLATNWSVSSDGLTYTFNLRQGVKFSNGDNFSAYDVWFNYYRLTLNNGPPAYIIGPVMFSAGSVTIADLNSFNYTNPTAAQLAVMENSSASIQVVNKYEVAFHLATPLGSFLARLAAPPGGIEDSAYVEAHGGVQNNGTVNSYIDANGAPGTGPYVVSSWVHGQSITLGLNKYYWGKTPKITTVVIQYKSNTNDAINDLKDGAAQMMYTVPVSLISSFNTTTGITLENHGLSFDLAWLSLNTAVAPLNNTDVRLAINYAINKTAIIQNVVDGYGVPFQGPVPTGMFGYNSSITPIGYNLTEAKALLTQAGFPGGSGIRPLSLMYYTGDPVILATVQAVESDLSQIGITVNLNGVSQATYFNTAATVPRVSNYPDIFWSAWFPDFAYPDDYAYSFDNIASAFDNSNINNTLLNTWTNQALNSPNPTTQAQLYSQVQALDKQLSPNVWLWQFKVGDGVPAYLSSVQNVYWNPILYGFNYSSICTTSTGC